MSTPRTPPSSPAAPKPPASVEIPPALRTRIETAIRAAIPDATAVHLSITKRTKGHGVRREPWTLWIAANHPPRGDFGSTTTSIVNSIGFRGCFYETPEKALATAESETARWIEGRAAEARRRSVSCAKEALVFERRCLLEREESKRLGVVLAEFREDPVLTADGADGADGQSHQTTTEPR